MRVLFAPFLAAIFCSQALAQNSPDALCSEEALLGGTSTENRTSLLACLESLAAAQPSAPELPAGTVIAVDGRCPRDQGWEPYVEGNGKFIIGTGAGILIPTGPHAPNGDTDPIGLTALSLGDQGGVEAHRLTIPEMPRHSHGGTLETGGHSYEHHQNNNRLPGQTFNYNRSTEAAGGNVPHNNMPPFIALNYCIYNPS
ncbi:hypothetical protein [Pontivivens ytuae]|uniref:Phage Tail Collar Domain protein n=1 Tax=Pontivivens ytuae TaxID=2789856 RepID=A0A7S9LT03_9RHOB|nr:hypothetical protein [Pontivivens ytuae]QPH54736.1 hypothetical protein I0K15_02860 [Pontivivens ytuae]